MHPFKSSNESHAGTRQLQTIPIWGSYFNIIKSITCVSDNTRACERKGLNEAAKALISKTFC